MYTYMYYIHIYLYIMNIVTYNITMYVYIYICGCILSVRRDRGAQTQGQIYSSAPPVQAWKLLWGGLGSLVCVCVCERERERESLCVCGYLVRMYEWYFVCVKIHRGLGVLVSLFVWLLGKKGSCWGWGVLGRIVGTIVPACGSVYRVAKTDRMLLVRGNFSQNRH